MARGSSLFGDPPPLSPSLDKGGGIKFYKRGAGAPLRHPTKLVLFFISHNWEFRVGGNFREGAKPQIHYREFKRDFVPLQKKILPFPFDKGKGIQGIGLPVLDIARRGKVNFLIWLRVRRI